MKHNLKEKIMTNKTEIKWSEKIALGKVDGRTVYLSAPKWDCGWYWGFGYLGNNNCHYHVDGLTKIEKYNTDKKVCEYEFVNLFNGFKKHFDDGTFLVSKDSYLWTLCELFETFYILRHTAEVLGRGGSHCTTNPCQSIIMNKEEAERINNVVLPSVFNEIYRILKECETLPKKHKEIRNLIVKGDTMEVVKFMNDNDLHTDDLKNVDGLTKHDINVVHSLFWSEFHKNK